MISFPCASPWPFHLTGSNGKNGEMTHPRFNLIALRVRRFSRSVPLLIAIAAFSSARPASAQSGDGTWTGTGGTKLWDDSTQWQGPPIPGNYADGQFATADLSTSTLASNQIIILDLNVTLGILKIGDFGGFFSYEIQSSGSNKLPFDNGGSPAEI